jgi:ligand-binding sensor domain-containing protein/predicted small secreted protein
MRKTVFLAVVVLSLLLQSCNGQNSKGDLQNGATERAVDTSSLIPQSISNRILAAGQSDWISEVVRTIFQDSGGTIWFGTQNGAFKLAGDTLIHIGDIKDEYGKPVTIKDLAEDKDGTLWLAHTDGVSSIKGEIVTNYYESDGLISHDVWCIEAHSNGDIWIGTIKGACVFNGKDFMEFELPEGKVDSTLGISSTKMVHNIYEDKEGTLWFSTNAGLFSYSQKKLVNVSKEVGIQTNFVNELLEDGTGAFWISTQAGLYYLKDGVATNITAGKIELGKGIGSMAKDKDGKLWVVIDQHSLYTYDGTELVEFQKSESNRGPVVFQIFNDQNGRLWFVGYGGAYRLENGNFVHISKDGPW